MSDAKPDVRPLGLIALGTAILGVALSVTYFLSPIALVVAVVALVLGWVSRSDPETRGMGTLAIMLGIAAIAASCAMIMFADFQV